MPVSAISRAVFAAIMATAASHGSELLVLAGLDGASGDESRVIDFIERRVGGTHLRGSNGSLIAEFGEGVPRTLLVAGVDEPGLAVSGIHEEGYLRVTGLAESISEKKLSEYFLGQHVNISTRSGKLLPGVVAARSVHFGATANRWAPNGAEQLFIDIGAKDEGDVMSVGVAMLDRVTLAKRPAFVSSDWLASAWISNRAGAEILLQLAGRIENADIDGSVVLAFVTQQHPSNAGFARALRSVQADRVVLLAADGRPNSSVGAIPGAKSGLVGEILSLAEREGQVLEHRGPHRLSFGPFGNGDVWESNQQAAAIFPAVRNRGTPAEAVLVTELGAVADLLARLVGVEPDPERKRQTRSSRVTSPAPPRSTGVQSSLSAELRKLVSVTGVSGHEDQVREELLRLLPSNPAIRVHTDRGGNLIVRVGANTKPAAAFLAHMDEIGHVVRRVSPEGVVETTTIGGGNPRLFSQQPITVHTTRGPLPALMLHIGRVDLGNINGAAVRALGIQDGDQVTVPKRYRELLGSRVSARSLDDRLGCVVLVEAIRELADPARRARGSVEFVFTVEEETGLQGARHRALRSNPRRVYPIDTFVTSDTPLESRQLAYAPLGAGPVLRAIDQSGITPRREVQRVSMLAKQHRIPIQLGVTAGGNDGAAFVSLETVSVPIGFPLRYAHTPVETADLGDAEATVRLVEVLALEALMRNDP